MLLQEQSSYVGEVIKPMDKKKVLVKVCLHLLFNRYPSLLVVQFYLDFHSCTALFIIVITNLSVIVV